MKQANDIVKELKELNSTLAYMPRTMPYVVPEGYFDTLHEYVQAGIITDSNGDPVPAFNSKAMPYELPGSYFETLPDDILASLKRTETTAFPKVNTFEVPQQYFEALPAQILQKVKAGEKPVTKTIPLGNSIWKNVRWAAAAILLIGISFGSYRMLQPSRSLSTEQQLAQIPDEVISGYIHQNIDDFETDAIAGALAMNDVPTAVSQLSNEEIINYLDETGWETTIN